MDATISSFSLNRTAVFLWRWTQKIAVTFEAVMKGKICAEIGKVTKDPILKIMGSKGSVVVDADVSDLHAAWKRTLGEEA